MVGEVGGLVLPECNWFDVQKRTLVQPFYPVGGRVDWLWDVPPFWFGVNGAVIEETVIIVGSSLYIQTVYWGWGWVRGS